MLSRPPLSRTHLQFPPLDASSPTLGTSSSLFSQPSTSSAPGPFSTGFSLVKEIKDNLSQHEDDNISTTSGFSSRASDKGKTVFLCMQGHAFGLDWMSGWIFVTKWSVKSLFYRCSHFQNSITSPALVPRDGQNQHWTPAFPVQSEKACFQPVSIWNLHHCEYLSIP